MHLTILLVGTFVVNISLPYTNGLRYLYNILPIMIMYNLYGFQLFWKLADKAIWTKGDAQRLIITIASLGVLFFSIANQVYRAGNNVTHWNNRYSYDAFSKAAKEMYRYIQKNTSEESVVAFSKPRMLYLTTNRQSFKIGVNGHDLSEADYYLKNRAIDFEVQTVDTTGMDVVFENEYLTLYKTGY